MLSQKNSSAFAEAIQSKIIAPENLSTFGEQQRGEGKTIATVNGAFDLLHLGHLEMIYQASLQADVIVVLLNSDASIQAYKSKDRPIRSLEERLQQIAALEMVDYVSSFEEEDPRAVLTRIKPNVHVNGSEYGENCLEAETVQKHGGKIHVVPLVPGLSSTNLIERILKVRS